MFSNVDEFVGNIILNLSARLLPKDLQRSGVEALKSELGPNWFTRLGYTDDKYERPKITGG